MISLAPERDESDLPADFAAFDIETAPLDDAVLAALCPPCEKLPPDPGEFDESSVKYGQTKDPVKRAEKLASVKAAHAAAVASYESDVDKAQAEHFAKFKSEAALHAEYGRVVAIGVSPCPITGEGPAIIDCDGDKEEAGLRTFWDWVTANLDMQRPMIGFNIHNFDLDFLRKRSLILGVSVPIGVYNRTAYNPWSILFLDVMREWSKRDFVKLNTLLQAFGLAGKVVNVDGVDINGKEFYLAWRDPKRRKAAETYLIRDLSGPKELALRMGIV